MIHIAIFCSLHKIHRGAYLKHNSISWLNSIKRKVGQDKKHKDIWYLIGGEQLGDRMCHGLLLKCQIRKILKGSQNILFSTKSQLKLEHTHF